MRCLRVIFSAACLLGFLVNSYAYAGIFGKNLWCDRWFAREPREIAVFREDLEPVWTAVKWGGSFWHDGAKYAAAFMSDFRQLMGSERYLQHSAELRARLISYALVKWIEIPRHRDPLVIAVADYLLDEINGGVAYSPEDLERLHLSFTLFQSRIGSAKSRFFDDAGSGWARITGVSLGVDTATTLIVMAATNIALPGIGFLPIPWASLIAILTDKISRNNHRVLKPDTIAKVQVLETALTELRASRISVSELYARWQKSFAKTLKPTGALVQAGLLRNLVADTCRVLATKSEQKLDGLKVMTKVAGDLGGVNPFEWQEIFESLKILKTTAVQLAVTQSEARPLIETMLGVTRSWTSNENARLAVDAFINVPLDRQSLFPAEDVGN